MHAVIFQVDMKPGWEDSADEELNELIGLLGQVPGFVKGTWTTDGTRGLSVVQFESEDVARGIAANAAMPPDASVVLRSAEVYQVVREA